jgi:hypothetical protein
MNSRISCPACGGKITGERFMMPIPNRAVWYQFERQAYKCPHCEVDLAYDRRSNLLVAAIGILVTVLMGMVFMGRLPILAIGVVLPVLFLLFFKVRRLVVRTTHKT